MTTNNNTTASIFSIFDSKAEVFDRPFFSQTIETAKREFSMAINDPKGGNFHKFTEDFALFYFGEFDAMEGKFDLIAAPKHICNAVTLREANGPLSLFPTEETTPDV